MLVALDYQTWFLIDAKTQSFYPVVQHANNLILFFMNINENIRNYRKIAEKLRGFTYKITYSPSANCPRVANMVPK